MLTQEIKRLVAKKLDIGRNLDGHFHTVRNLKLLFSSVREETDKELDAIASKPHDSTLATIIRNTIIELTSSLGDLDEEEILASAPEIPLKKLAPVVTYRKMIPLDKIQPTAEIRTSSYNKRPKLFDKEYKLKVKSVKSKVTVAIKKDIDLNITLENLEDIDYESYSNSDFLTLKTKINRMLNTADRYGSILTEKEDIHARKYAEIEKKVEKKQEVLENISDQNQVLSEEVKKLEQIAKLIDTEKALKEKIKGRWNKLKKGEEENKIFREVSAILPGRTLTRKTRR